MGATASAQIVYDNTSSSLGQRTAEGNAEIGDAVTFAGGPATISQISFEYFVTPGASGNETAQLFLYSMNGTAGLPGTLLYSSPTFNLVPATSAGFGDCNDQWYFRSCSSADRLERRFLRARHVRCNP